MTALAKTIEMKPEDLAEIQKTEDDIIYDLNEFVTDNNIVEDLSNAICTLLCDSIQDSLENNAMNAHSLAFTISFMMKQRKAIENLNFLKRNSHE